MKDSANVSRRSEERPLISANELLRFPLDEVLVLPEGQYSIRARQVRYYEDRHFGPIDRASRGNSGRMLRAFGQVEKTKPAALSSFAKAGAVKSLVQAKVAFQGMKQVTEATSRREQARKT